MQKEKIRIEVCVDSVESAIAAQEGGAYRVELCDNLYEGGTTPSAGTIDAARENLHIKLNVIVRPRGGDFLYSEIEYEIIKKDVLAAKDMGVNGIVIGFLKDDGSIDIERTGEIVELAQPLPVTFHRAFDMCRYPFEALEELIDTGVNRILTSGQKDKAEDGIKLLTELVRSAGDRIIIMPGSGIDENNIRKIHSTVKASEYHVSLRKMVDSGMTFRREGIHMGGRPDIPEFELPVTDAGRIRALIEALCLKCKSGIIKNSG